jgi:hypothetical protein
MSSFRLVGGALLTTALAFASACTDSPLEASATAATTARPRPPGPPQASIDACASSAAGDACAFDLDQHHVTGTCRRGPDDQGPLGCAPDQPPRPPAKPPQEALDACDGLAVDDACTIALPDGSSLDGTCRTPPDGSALLCAPHGAPPPPR